MPDGAPGAPETDGADAGDDGGEDGEDGGADDAAAPGATEPRAAATPAPRPAPGPGQGRGPQPNRNQNQNQNQGQRQRRPERGDRPQGDRPERGPRPPGDRAPRGERPPGDRPERGERPAAERAPSAERGDRGKRPERGSRAERPERGDRAERPRREDRDARARDRAPGGPTAADRDPRHAPPRDDVDESGEHQPVRPAPDDLGPAPEITLGPDLPPEPPDDDPDPASWTPAESEAATSDGAAALAQHVVQPVGVKFQPAGRISWFDGGDAAWQRGDRVVVEVERGTRVGTVATVVGRRGAGDRALRKIVRRARPDDDTVAAPAALVIAKDRARELRLPVKIFRVEAPASGGKRLLVYYTSDERVDLRDLIRDLGAATGARVELRQVGARDEAKLVGGIGSCGLELCCSTWLPETVPVSIKMAKDQGMVLNPTKVSGQCGRLKCCLVYEQATYAELRKGLPRLGKRVYTPTGEGRVVEVDVLRQRIRVATGPGESEVLAAHEIRPMFPSGNAPHPGAPAGRGDEPDAEPDDAPDDEPEPDAAEPDAPPAPTSPDEPEHDA